MSQNERMSMPPPKITSDGKYVCTVDNTTFAAVVITLAAIIAALTVLLLRRQQHR